MEKPTREQLLQALADVLDGTKDHELPEMTGLSDARCKEIWEIYCAALRELGY